MTTRNVRGTAALALGIAVLAGAAGAALAKDDKPSSPSTNQGRPISNRPILKVKPQNDLAAISLVTTFEGDPTAGTAKLIMVGTCKNVGVKPYKGPLRTVRIEKKINGAWITQEAKTLPDLAPGKSFSLSMGIKPNDKADYRLEVTAGGPADDNPKNDIFVPSAAPVEPPK